ncbi:MAG: DUF4112 domain-containing protein [Planctomycetaceae bacterium]|nr:DUF4112 domain-containing protein [Planctomycetaceae bacterium]
MSTRTVDPILITDPSQRPATQSEVQESVDRLERLTKLMDEAFVLPFLNRPVGLDALIGLIPAAGDLITAAIAGVVVMEAKRLGASKWLISRMTWNVIVDSVGGAIPLAGDVFDVYFRANRRNLTLLKNWLRKQGYELAKD